MTVDKSDIQRERRIGSMSGWKRAAIAADRSILDVMRLFDANSESIALVVDERDRLLGTVTDGDVRRAILAGEGLDEPVALVMNRSPITLLGWEATREQATSVMNQRVIRYLPVVDADGRVLDLMSQTEVPSPRKLENWVVLMTGGEGRRLMPLTRTCPKPMIHIGGKPILEVIMRSFLDQGFHKFYFSVNYMADMIRDHFGDGSRWNAEIRYLEEHEKMGTAGALSLLPEPPGEPFFVVNGDLLTRVDFRGMLEFHIAAKHVATLGVREYKIEVPYGVVALDNGRVTGITEKPIYNYFINAGIYVLDPDCLHEVRSGEPVDMPTLFSRLLDHQQTLGSFPIHEYWIDIGRVADLERAHEEFEIFFR